MSNWNIVDSASTPQGRTSAEAAHLSARVLRVFAVSLALLSVVASVLMYGPGRSDDSFNSGPARLRWGQGIQTTLFALGFAVLAFGISILVDVYASRPVVQPTARRVDESPWARPPDA
jgi:hypothetical protein